jgi:hypothetical protein
MRKAFERGLSPAQLSHCQSSAAIVDLTTKMTIMHCAFAATFVDEKIEEVL